MERSKIRKLLIDRTVEYVRPSQYIYDGVFTTEMARFGLKTVIEQADSKEEFAMLSAYYWSIDEKARNKLAAQIKNTALRLGVPEGWYPDQDEER